MGSPESSVRTSNGCIVPAFSEMLLDVVSDQPILPGCMAIVEAPLHACTVLVARGICRDACNVVLVSNPTPTDVALEGGAVLGRMIPLPDDEVLLHDTASMCTAVTSAPGSLFLPPELDLSEAQRLLTRQQLRQLHAVISRYGDVWATESNRGVAVGVEHHVELSSERPFAQPPRRLSPAERQTVDKMTAEMVNDGVVEPSESPWASPIVLVNKKDGSVRFCVDYRALNKVTKRDVYPLPRIDDLLGALEGMRYFSSLDLKSGYWQIPMAEADKEKTAFITPGGLYQFRVMPFGLTNAPATFQRMMDLVLAGIKWQHCLVYLDDVLVFSRTFDEHLSHLASVFDRLRKAGLRLAPKKCHVCRQQVHYLGHVVSARGVSVDPAKTSALARFPTPLNSDDVRSFLGIAGYYRRFIPDFARRAEPLSALLREATPFIWSAQCETAFNDLKEALQNPPVLCHPDYSKPFVLDTDASGYGLGATLCQMSTVGGERVVAYASRTLSAAERKWHTRELEALAIIWAIELFRPYIWGRHFTVRSDHRNLQWLQEAKRGRLARWALRLQEYDFTIAYRPGKQQQHVDALSRNPEPAGAEPLSLDDDLPRAQVHVVTVPSSAPRLPSLRDIRTAQQDDGDIQSYKQASSQGRSPFVVVDDVLYHSSVDEDGQAGEDVRKLRVVVPRVYRADLMWHYHASELAAHLGRDKTYRRLQQRFYWPSMKADIAAYVAGCELCQRRKRPQQRHQGLLQPIRVAQPWDIVGLDIFGPLPTTRRNNRFIVVFIDHFTKWPEVIPTNTITAEVIASLLHNRIVCRFGCPQTLLTDRGPQFVAAITRNLCERYGIRKAFTSAYHPQGDPVAEAFMKTLAASLSILTTQYPAEWDELCESMAFAYRTSVHPSTGDSPFYLNYGRDAILPQDLTALDSSAGHDSSRRLIVLREAREAARRQLWAAQDRAKRYYDAHQRDTAFSPGDLVLVRLPDHQIGSKLDPRWSEPRRVVRALSNGVTYEVRSLDTGALSVVHVQRLSAFRPYAELPQDESPAPSSAQTATHPQSSTPAEPPRSPQDDDADDDWCGDYSPIFQSHVRQRSIEAPIPSSRRRCMSPAGRDPAAARQRLLDLLCPSARVATQ